MSIRLEIFHSGLLFLAFLAFGNGFIEAWYSLSYIYATLRFWRVFSLSLISPSKSSRQKSCEEMAFLVQISLRTAFGIDRMGMPFFTLWGQEKEPSTAAVFKKKIYAHLVNPETLYFLENPCHVLWID